MREVAPAFGRAARVLTSGSVLTPDQLFRFREPRNLRGNRRVTPVRYDLRYPDGAHPASALLVNPATSDVYVVTRDASGGGIYQAPDALSSSAVNDLVRVADAPDQVTGGGFSAAGLRVVLSSPRKILVGSSLTAQPDAIAVPDGFGAANAEFSRTGDTVLVNGAPARRVIGALRWHRHPKPSPSPTPTDPTTTPPSSPPPTTTPPTGWTLNLAEEFGSLDTTRWKLRDHQCYARDSAAVLARNDTVSDGSLRVQGKLESSDGRSYTSGDLDTYGTYSLPNYFRIEVRAKVPFEQGMWAAPLWIRPSDGSSGEIDLIETYGSEAARPIIHQTIHSAYGTTHQQTHLQTPYSKVSTLPATDWHTYVVEKTKGEIRMWVDGTQTALFNTSNTPWFNTYYEVGKRWSLRASLQIGGGQGLPDSTTDWAPDKTAMLVDYIRTYTQG